MSFTENIIGKIEQENIQPLPSWWFHVRYGFFWILFLVALFLGSIAFSLILYFLFEGDILLAPNPLSHFIEMLPWLWIASFFLLFSLGYWGLRHTSSGYKIPLWGFLFGNIALSFFLGIGWYFLGIPDTIDRATSRIVPLHHSLEQRKEIMWSRADLGMIAGVIRERNGDMLIVEGPRGRQWEVMVSPHLARSFREGQRIKVKGIHQGGVRENLFRAESIIPWRRQSYY